jgi:L-alanine-DL-glutamate epimerase-like enolase superfamily enzyme
MKITEVVTTILRTNSLFVRVRTSDGVTGIGECSPMNCRVIKAMVDHALAPLVIGEDPRDVDRLWHKMFYRTYKLGVMGAQMEGIAGIDIALWDILGKATGLPVSTLLGGRYRETIPCTLPSAAGPA